MAIGFVLISIDSFFEARVYNALTRIPEVIAVNDLFGEYDFIIKLNVNNFEDLGRVITDKIKPIEGISNIKTLTGINILKEGI